MIGTDVTRVLVVDDQRSFCNLARHIFSKEGGRFDVTEAYDAQAALRLIQDIAPDLVLMDVELPGMNGLEATSRIRILHPSVKVIVMSFHEEQEYRKLALDAGAIGFIPKRSFSVRRILQTLGDYGWA